MTFQANARIGGNLGCPVVGRSVPKTGQVLGTDKTAMDFRRRLSEIVLSAPGGAGWGSVRFTPVVNTEDADEIRWFEAEEDPPLADPQAQFTGPVFEGLPRRGETYQ